MLSRNALVLAALLLLAACSRAQHPAEAPAPPLSPFVPASPAAPVSPPAETAAATAANSPPVEIASAPHPVETSTPTNAPSAPPANAPALRFLVPAGHAPGWLIDELDATIGARITVRTYATAAELDAALQSPDAPFDLVGVADRPAAALLAQHKLRELPETVAPPLAQPAPTFLHHAFDPLNRYTWPYAFTLYGFAAPSGGAVPPRSWRGLGGEMALAFAGDAALRSVLWEIALNKPPGEAGPLPPAWQKAALDTPADAAPAGTVRIDTVARLRALAPAGGEVVLPAEGSAIVLYSWAIPADAPQAALAEAALRTLAIPARAARLAADLGLATTQPAARRLLPPAAQADPLVYPGERVMNQCRFVRPK